MTNCNKLFCLLKIIWLGLSGCPLMSKYSIQVNTLCFRHLKRVIATAKVADRHQGEQIHKMENSSMTLSFVKSAKIKRWWVKVEKRGREVEKTTENGSVQREGVWESKPREIMQSTKGRELEHDSMMYRRIRWGVWMVWHVAQWNLQSGPCLKLCASFNVGRNLLRGEARLDCKTRSTTEKESVIRGEEKAKGKVEEGAHLEYVGPNWITIFLIGQILLWQAAHKETACLLKAQKHWVKHS